MHKELVKQAFEEIKKIEKAKTGISPSKTGAAKLLSDFIYENQKFQIGEKSLSIFFNMANNKNNNETVIKQPVVVQALCELLGYKNFEAFKRSKKNNLLSILMIFFKRYKIVILSVLISSGILFYFFNNRQHWMMWIDDHYEKTRFDSEKYNLNNLTPYNEDKARHFKKVEVDCDSTIFFNSKGEAIIWYGKNTEKELEYFSALGKHPETGKALRPITRYMIDKYICVDK